MARRKQAHPYLASQQAVNKAMVDGVGGLSFTAMSPPGIGRLIRIPFYLTTGQANQIASLAENQTAVQTNALITNGTTSATVPWCIVDFGNLPGAANGQTNIAIMQTPQISWATLRIVGFECNALQPVLSAASQGEVCFSDLQIGGGASLFVHEDFAPSDIYLVGQPSFAGLRDYPVLKSPNVASVNVAAVGINAASPRITFSANLVCEVLVDDNYGAHLPGPYARAGAMVRQGGSFVSG
jgi:hypothetical protein